MYWKRKEQFHNSTVYRPESFLPSTLSPLASYKCRSLFNKPCKNANPHPDNGGRPEGRASMNQIGHANNTLSFNPKC
jgi:hypothetical protein